MNHRTLELLPEIAIILRQNGYQVIEHSANGIIHKLTAKWNAGKKSSVIRRGDIDGKDTDRINLNNEMLIIDWKNEIWKVKEMILIIIVWLLIGTVHLNNMIMDKRIENHVLSESVKTLEKRLEKLNGIS